MWLWLVEPALALTVGVVHDDSGGTALMDDAVAEVERLAPDVSWVPAPVADPGAALDALADEVDVLLVVGPLACAVARTRSDPGVPVVTVLDLSDAPPPDWQIPIPVPLSLDDARRVASRLADGDVAVVVSDPLWGALGDRDVLRVTDPVPEGVGALVTVGLPRGTEAEQRRAYAAWAEQGLVTVALSGDVRVGATAALRLDDVAVTVGRRLALVLSDLEAGEPARVGPARAGAAEVVLAMDALQALGRSAPFDLLAEAELVWTSGEPPTLSLEEAMATAFASSPSLHAERSRLLAEDRASWGAVARWAPDVSGSIGASAVDPEGIGALQPSAQVSAGVVAEQVLWSDAAATGVRARGDQIAARDHERADLEQDLAHDVLTAYIGALRTQAVVAVHRADLDRVREALAVAGHQLQAGAGTPGDVARWESEVASARSNLVAAWADQVSASLALDQVRGVVGVSAFRRVQDVEPRQWAGLRPIERPDQLARAGDVVAAAAVERSPAVSQLDDLVRAQSRLAGLSRRAGWMPTVAGQVGVQSSLWVAATDPLVLPGVGAVEVVPEAPNVYWTAGIKLSMPLFSGGSHRATARSERATLDRLEHQRLAVEQATTTRARRAVQIAHAAGIEQRLAQDRVEAIHVSLDAVTEAYAAGAVPQTRLTEARTSALAAEIQAADAEYAVLQSLVDLAWALAALPTPSRPDAPDAALAVIASALETP